MIKLDHYLWYAGDCRWLFIKWIHWLTRGNNTSEQWDETRSVDRLIYFKNTYNCVKENVNVVWMFKKWVERCVSLGETHFQFEFTRRIVQIVLYVLSCGRFRKLWTAWCSRVGRIWKWQSLNRGNTLFD